MDVWKIGVAISLTNGMSPVLALIAKDLLGIKGHVGEVERAFGSWNTAIMGAGAALAGSALIEGVFKLADGGKELLDQQDKLQRSGMALNDVLKVQKDYYDSVSKSIPTASADEYLKTINEMQSVVGLNMAQQTAPFALKLDAIIANALGKDVSGSGFSLWRALEMRGTTISDPEGSSKLGNMFAQDIIGSGGKLTADTFQSMAKRGGAAWINASPEFLAGPAAVVAGDLGGDTAGTAMMSLYQLLSGATTMSKQQFETLAGAGLIDLSKASVDKGGRVNAQPGAIIGSDIGLHDQQKWVQDFLMPGIEKSSGGDKAMADSMLAQIGRNRNTTRMLTMYSDPGFQEQFTKDIALWQRASPVDKAYDDSMARNPMLIDKGFDGQFKSMMEALGGPMAQATIPVMKDLTTVFNTIGAFANSHPETIALVGRSLLALGVGLAALGTFAVGAALVGLATAPVVVGGAITAFGALIALNWHALSDMFYGWEGAFKQFMATMSSFGFNALGSHPGIAPRNQTAPQPWAPPTSGGRGIHPTSWVPPSGASQPTVIHTAINIDGRTMARAVSYHMAANSPGNTGSSSFDGRAMWAPTDVSSI